MLRTIGWMLWMAGYLIGSLPTYLRVRRLEKRGMTDERDRLVRRRVLDWTPKLMRHIKMSVEVAGRENLPPEGEAVVYVANHQSYLDIPVMLQHLPRPYPLMAKREIASVPMLGGWIRQLGCVLVEREDARAALEKLKEAERLLAGGSPLIIFPEGTRSRGGPPAEFKAGAVRVAVRAGVRIVPVALQGTAHALEANRFRLRPSAVRMAILPPVETAGLDRAGQRALPERLRELITRALEGDVNTGCESEKSGAGMGEVC